MTQHLTQQGFIVSFGHLRPYQTSAQHLDSSTSSDHNLQITVPRRSYLNVYQQHPQHNDNSEQSSMQFFPLQCILFIAASFAEN